MVAKSPKGLDFGRCYTLLLQLSEGLSDNHSVKTRMKSPLKWYTPSKASFALLSMNPPEDFLDIPLSVYRHEFASGERAGYSWLVSNKLQAQQLLEHLKLPAEGIRLVASGISLSIPNKKFVVTDVLRGIPASFCFGRCLAMPHTFVKSELLPLIAPIGKLMEWRLPCECIRDWDLWRINCDLSALVYICARMPGVCVMTQNSELITRTMNAHAFLSMESEELRRLKEERLQFLMSVGPERGPEFCVVSGCNMLRVARAVRCIRHQYEWGHEHAADGIKTAHRLMTTTDS